MSKETPSYAVVLSPYEAGNLFGLRLAFHAAVKTKVHEIEDLRERSKALAEFMRSHERVESLVAEHEELASLHRWLCALGEGDPISEIIDFHSRSASGEAIDVMRKASDSSNAPNVD